MASRKRASARPIALAPDGTLFVNLAAADDTGSAEQLLRRARRSGREVFVGVALTGAEARRVVKRLEDASAEAAAVVLATRRRKRRP
jgi:hypothetical protein